MAANKTRTFWQQVENSRLPIGIFSHLFASLNLREVRVVQEALGILEDQKVPKRERKIVRIPPLNNFNENAKGGEGWLPNTAAYL